MVVTERQRIANGSRHPTALALATIAVLLAFSPGRAVAFADDTSIPLTAAAERGAFNVGPSRGEVSKYADPSAGREVLKFDYSLPPGTAAGVWAKAFPAALNSEVVDLVRLAVKATDPEQLKTIAVTVEIKGTTGVQKVPISLHPDWKYAESFVDWPAIGQVSEVVVAVSRTSGDEVATGTLYVDVRFEQLPIMRKLTLSPVARIAGVLFVGLLGGLVTALLWTVFGPARPTAIGAQGFKRDLVQGVGAVGIAGLALWVYLIGERGPLEIGWTAISVAVAGGVLAEWLKFGLTGKHLSPVEVVQDMVATGLLAASTSTLAVLQAPATWSEGLLLSRTTAAAVTFAYHAANAHRLSSAGRHLPIAGGASIVGTPYLVGSLLLLRSDGLMQSLGGFLTAGYFTVWPAALMFVGRVVVLVGFNEVVANGLSLVTKQTPLRSIPAHLSIIAVAIDVVGAPWIASYGSGEWVAGQAVVVRLIVAVATTMLSQVGLWAEIYLITGMVMDAIHGRAPTAESVSSYIVTGMKKGMIFSGAFMAILYVPGVLWGVTEIREFVTGHPLFVAAFIGAMAFPLLKTVIESFDGSPSFLRRLAKSYRDPILFVRGAVVGLGVGFGITAAISREATPDRAWYGFVVGIAAFAGVNLLRDCYYTSRGQGRVQSWRVYLVQGLLGGFVGAALGFYFDTPQVTAVLDKFQQYLAAGAQPKTFEVYPLLSKWGHINLVAVTGGVSLFFAESLAGVIEWSIPAWLFALNRTFLAAYFRKESTPITALFTRDGLVGLTENMLAVLRWGLWMSPIIKTFLRPVGDPTWYNQDGAVRTLFAIIQDVRLSPDAFRDWSLSVFIALLAYDSVRVLIWLDHMGLRVATLVNLSFLGVDKLEQRLARFLTPAATARCIPEAVKRFTTWAPLLIPFYIPRGADWDKPWSQSEAIQRAAEPGPLAWFISRSLGAQLLCALVAVVAGTALFSTTRWLRGRFGTPIPRDRRLTNRVYEVVVKENGEVFSQVRDRGYDVTRRSYDTIDPAGRTLFVVDTTAGQPPRAWPVIGNYPADLAAPSQIDGDDDGVEVCNTANGLRTTIDITLANADDPAELWTVTVENLTHAPRAINVVPYLEWVLNRPDADRGHTQYNRLFAELHYDRALKAIVAIDRHSKATGFLAADVAADGYLTSRVDFIGRGRSLWTPRVLDTLAFAEATDAVAHPTFDPIGSLLLSTTLPALGSVRIRLLIGLTNTRKQAEDLIARHLQTAAGQLSEPHGNGERASQRRFGHGEISPGSRRPYAVSDDGRQLTVHTTFTPRPFDHTLSNGLGHIISVTNRGLHTTANVNAQQNRLTPDWSDTVTREFPSEAFYLYDPDRHEWYSPTYHPLNDADANYETAFGVDGTATFRMTRGDLETELTVFAPPDEPTGVYLLTVRNRANARRQLRLAAYFQMVLAGQPEYAGPLRIRRDEVLNALFFENPRNTFRTGPAFVAMSRPAEAVVTRRGDFFGAGRGVAHPALMERGEPDLTRSADDRPVAAFLATLDVAAHDECTVVVLLGQADDRRQAEAVIRRLLNPAAAQATLDETRRWWLRLMDSVCVETTDPDFDRYLDWLKYQALAERIWARRGFYQASGAFGFRDQLQDAVNLIWADPAIARRQLLLHASQQFLEGDVVHWFHMLQDGRTGFVGRTHASDNLLWLAWGVVEYVAATGEESILDEQTPYLEAEQPFEPLPAGKHGMGFDPLRSARQDSVYRHCLRAIDLVLDKRMGAHGLPLIGTGDWNDGLDEIGSQGKGESVWLGLFLHHILERIAGIVGQRDGPARQDYYRGRLQQLDAAIEQTWRGDRYLRAIHDDGTEIGVAGSGVWEIDALTAAWAVMANINPQRGRIVFDTAVGILERDTTILLGWPPLREDTKPYLGRSSQYPEGVRENGMYCHGVQWLVGAARILAEQCDRDGQPDDARRYRETAYRLWRKISPIPHTTPDEIETYGGQPNKQAADLVTTLEPGRMIWNGYTGAAGWMFRQALEGVLGLRLVNGEVVSPSEQATAGALSLLVFSRDLAKQTTETPRTQRMNTEHQPRKKWIAFFLVFLSLGSLSVCGSLAAQVPAPTIPVQHKHVRALLENALRYAVPDHRMTDPSSGYPFEGWNQDPKQGLFLRSFTQLTAIGLWMELLANIASGHADCPIVTRDKALADLAHLLKSLRQDQHDPRLSAKGLLGNFLDLATGKRLSPLAADVEKDKFLDAFGREKGEAIWKALEVQGWIGPRKDGQEADVKRGDKFGANHFDGALAPYRDDATKTKIMSLLDARVVTVVFVDNANLSASVAKTIGALLHPMVKDRPDAAALRRDLEQFLEDQRPGYTHLYDAKAGLFFFGWDATKDRLFGWVDLEGKWVTGHVDYLVNEFRGPATFVAIRYGLPLDAIKNLGFKIKPYRLLDGRDVYALAPWEGSAFQALGLGLWLNELVSPSWRSLLETAVDVEIDFAVRHKLPGFLSESYTGRGTQYTGDVGIPDITVNPKPRITDAASLYTLGVAYSIAPAKIEQFLTANWPVIERLFTDHGPWEGFNVTLQEPIRFQTTAHTASLILGILGTGSEELCRYLDSRDLRGRLSEVFRVGESADLLAAESNVFAWAPKDQTLRSSRDKAGFHVKGDRVGQVGIAFVSPRPTGVNLSGGRLTLRYRSAGPPAQAVIDLKPVGAPKKGLIANQIFTRLTDTGGREAEIQVTLPATPGLAQIKEVVILCGQGTEARSIDLSITGLKVTPVGVE